MPNPNDGTQLGTGEVISDEYIDPQTGGRRDGNLPATGYKVPRSKIAVGPYGQDWGEASEFYPLQVSDAIARRLKEIETMRDVDEGRLQLVRFSAERVSMSDNRGRHTAIRGTR